MKKYIILFFSIVQFSMISAQEKDTTFILKGIEISSTRKTTTSFKEPSAISIITSKDFSKSRGYGLDDALSLVPGVFAQSRYGNQDIRITIRGFGARGSGERSNSGTSRGIRILLDGFPETEPDGRTSFDQIDISTMSKMEVIRTNASALWGNGAGGLVSVSSNTTFEKPFVDVQTFYGGFGFNKNAIQVGAIMGSGKFFLNVSNTNSDGWRDHSSSTQTLLNSGIIAALSEQTKLGVYLLGTTNVFHIPGPLSQTQFNSNPQQAQADTSYYKPSYSERDERRFNRLGRIGVSLSHSIDESNDLSATAYINPKYLQRSERNSFRDFTRYHVGGSFVYRNQFLLNENIRMTTTIGNDEAYQDGAIIFYQLKNGQRDSIITDDKREGANSYGAFAQEEIFVNDNIIFSLGGRYDNVTYFAENFLNPTNLSDKKSFTKITPKIGITYLFNPTHSFYVSYGGGVEVPAGNETDPAQGQLNARSINPLLQPIISTTYEIGTKQLLDIDRFLTKVVSYDAAVYLISTVNDIVPYQNGRFYLTAGETRRIGLELGLTAQFDHGFTLSTSLSVSNNKYVDYTIDSVFTKRPINLTLSGKLISYKDNKLIGIPDYIFFTRLRYDASFVEGLYSELSLQNVGEYYADDSNILKVPSYNIINATIGYSKVLSFYDHLTLKGFITVNNLIDTKYISSAYINPDFGRVSTTSKQAIYIEPGFPQYLIASLGLSYSF